MKSQKEITEELRIFWGVKQFAFEAQYDINRRGDGFFRNLRKPKDGNVLILPNGNYCSVKAPSDNDYQVGKRYLIHIFVPKDEIRERFNNEYLIYLDVIKSPPKEITIDPEVYVRSLESEYNSIRGIGVEALRGAIKRISYDINRKPETFIFELLQNADDYPDKSRGHVEVVFSIVGDYLILQHNGLPFTPGNVRAICSVDAGEKEFDFEKIGYKGIGFKSIFKHSNYVVVHSGGFTFRFDEDYHRNRGRETFWQLIPVWTRLDELPREVIDTLLPDYSVAVVIRPEEGNSQLGSYEETFQSIFHDERVLLFLRWVSGLRFKGRTSSFSLAKSSEDWEISHLKAIVVPEELRESMDNRMKIDDRIPQKYQGIERTQLTFATRRDGQRIVPTDQSNVYAYLPTDLDFGFPFLLNGDFIPDGGRHYLHADLEWNQFLFEQAGGLLLEWISSLWQKYEDPGVILMLPDPDKLISERPGDEKDVLLGYFMAGLKTAKDRIPFIPVDDGSLVSSDKVILDDTGLFCLNNNSHSLFYEILSTDLRFPDMRLSRQRLDADYLGLRKYRAGELIADLTPDFNKIAFAKWVAGLDYTGYVELVMWLDRFYQDNDVDDSWILSLPFIRHKSRVGVFSIIVEEANFILRTDGISDVADVLRNSGFELSEFSVDEAWFKHIRAVWQNQESYLRSGKAMFEHISLNGNFLGLSALEKVRLISYLRGLPDVGPARYAGALRLFRATGNASQLWPLNGLISHECRDVPHWLSQFVIDPEEEELLSAELTKELLIESDFLSGLFGESESFQRIVEGVSVSEIGDLYAYMLKLYSDSDQKQSLPFHEMPWVYIEVSDEFTIPQNVYWPDSLCDLDAEKYNRVKKVLEGLSDCKIPHYAACQLKTAFGLGNTKIEQGSLIVRNGTFDQDHINDFLDWLQEEGFQDFFIEFSIKPVEGGFEISKAGDALQYYTTDKEVQAAIQCCENPAEFVQLPDVLYSEERQRIGLFVGEKLITALIPRVEHLPTIASVILKSGSESLARKFLDKLQEFRIDSTRKYNSEDGEFSVLKLVAKYELETGERLAKFKDKIFLDGQPLSERAVSADIRLYDEGDKPVYQFKHVELSQVIPAYTGRTYSSDEVIGCFVDFRDRDALKAVFRAQGRSGKTILRELIQLAPAFYTPEQVFFLSYYQTLHPRTPVLGDNVFFAPDSGSDAWKQGVFRFLDICLVEEKYVGFVEQGIFPKFFPNLLIVDDSLALESERLPDWLQEWMSRNPTSEAHEFLIKMGIHFSDSAVVLLRKGMAGDESVVLDGARAGVTNARLVINSFEWLATSDGNRVYTKFDLKALYELAERLKIEPSALPTPVPVKIDCKEFRLVQLPDKSTCHRICGGWGKFASEIFDHLKTKDEVIIDFEVTPVSFWRKHEVITADSRDEIDMGKLTSEWMDFDADFYMMWPDKDAFVIKIYPGSELPRRAVYRGITVAEWEDGVCATIDEKYVVAQSERSNIPHVLKSLNSRLFNDLNSWKSDFEKGKANWDLSPEEEKALEALFGGVVPEEMRKNQNLTALASILIYLNENGYDVTQANKELINTFEYAQLSPVFKGELKLTIMCRSARNGLLYLTKRAWDRLDEEGVELFVDIGRKEPLHFEVKQDVLASGGGGPDFQILRVESEANAAQLDDMLNGNFEDPGKLWLVFMVKKNDHFVPLFYKQEPDFSDDNQRRLREYDDYEY